MAVTHQRYDIEQVRERTDIVALIGQFVALRQRGGRHVGLCPFHQEKSPSFGVDAQKGFWHCFGCGKGGDAFTFLMEMEKLSFMETVERLAERAGIHPVETVEATQRKEERDFLYEVNAEAGAAFTRALRGQAGQAARGYLEKRGITPAQAQRFGLGYAPRGWDALVSHLPKRGFSVELMAKAGLALARNQGAGFVDRFHHRLMIPIHDRQGRVVAFGGRALAAEDNPKYLNTAETPIFHKSRMLYALHWAAEMIGKKNRVIITEGYFDVIACHLAGFPETVATLGTALGEDHIRLLRRFMQVANGVATKVYLVFDGDSAGINATLRSQALFRQAEMDVRIVCLPGGHDPDTFLREQGSEAFERCLAQALSPVEFEWDRLVHQHPGQDAQSRLRLKRAGAKLLQPLSMLEREEYARVFSERVNGGRGGDLGELQRALLSEVAVLERAPRGTRDATPPVATTSSVDNALELEVLTAMLQHPDFAATACTLIPAQAFSIAKYRAIFERIDDIISAGKSFDSSKMIFEDAEMASLVAEIQWRELLPLPAGQDTTLIDHLNEEAQNRQIKPEEIPLQYEAAEGLVALIQQRSARGKERHYADDDEKGPTEQTVVPVPDRVKNWATGRFK